MVLADGHNLTRSSWTVFPLRHTRVTFDATQHRDRASLPIYPDSIGEPHDQWATRTSRWGENGRRVKQYVYVRIPCLLGRIESGSDSAVECRLSMHSPATLERVLARTADAALIVDEAGTVLLANDRACQVLKYAPGELHGESLELLIPERFRLAHIGHRLRLMDDRRTRPMGADLELFALCKDGSECRVDVSLDPVLRGLKTLVVATIKVRDWNSRAPSGLTGEVRGT